jgi:hypothetical protein
MTETLKRTTLPLATSRIERIYGRLVAGITCGGGISVKSTYYESEDITIKATLRSRTQKRMEIVVTIGSPNHAERKFIKLAKKAGKSFPLKEIQLKPNWKPSK